MRVLVDTNVLVSAVLRDRDPEVVILYIAAQPDIEWVVSAEIVAEYKEVLSRKKFALPEELRDEWFETLDQLTTLIEVNNSIAFPRDPKDAKFLTCALVAQADFFITGDKDFTEAQKLLSTTILSVYMFKKLVCDTDDKADID